MKVLMLTIGFSPNVGGIETHFNDFLKVTRDKKIPVTVLTYQPLETKAKGKTIEKHQYSTIIRLPVIRGLFYKLIKNPILEFLFLFPELFLVTPFLILFGEPNIIHAHGIIAGSGAVFWGKVLKKKVIISTHSMYEFPKRGLYRWFAAIVFKSSNFILTLSNQSREEIRSLGISSEKIHVFTYWVNQDMFKPKKNKQRSRKNEFVVSFIGRLVERKGVLQLLEAAENWRKSIKLIIAGVGPLEDKVKKASSQNKNIVFLGNVSQKKLPSLYNSSDVVIVPSIHEEGFGRVIIEALSCGIPVIASDRGGIKEAMDSLVGYLINITPENIKNTVEYCEQHKIELKNKSKNAYLFTRKKYSDKNAEVILKLYE